MPKKLERCVRKVRRKGHSKDEAYAICSEATGYKVGKGSTKKNKKWVKRKRRRK